MQRHRCSHCRNPIRNLAVARSGSYPEATSWYHPDCWDAVCTSEQERYEQQVRQVGLAALLAPYLTASTAGAPTAPG